MDARYLLPSRDYEVEYVHPDERGTHLQLSIKPLAEGVVCPCCKTATSRVHSHYQRVVKDVAWGGCFCQGKRGPGDQEKGGHFESSSKTVITKKGTR